MIILIIIKLFALFLVIRFILTVFGLIKTRHEIGISKDFWFMFGTFVEFFVGLYVLVI